MIVEKGMVVHFKRYGPYPCDVITVAVDDGDNDLEIIEGTRIPTNKDPESNRLWLSPGDQYLIVPPEDWSEEVCRCVAMIQMGIELDPSNTEGEK